MPSTKTVEVGVKLYLNGFPKSGTHLLESMAINVVSQANKEDNWMGNLDRSGFGTGLIHLDTFPKLLEDMPMRRYIKGHAAWRPELNQAFLDNQWCKAFIYRDFRDVAVSMAYHAKRTSTGTHFPNKEMYEEMEIDEILTRVITGDENIDSLMERWELYAPWLDEDWVLKLDFGDVINNKELACELFLRYIYGRTARYYGVKAEIDADFFNESMHNMMFRLNHPEKSPTFRNGKTGGWKEHFTEEQKQLLKETDKNNWLIRLGYENDRKW